MENEKNQKKQALSRRNFFKLSAGAGLGVSLASLANASRPFEAGIALATDTAIQKHDDFPIELSADYERYRQKNLTAIQALTDPELMPYVMKYLAFEKGMVPFKDQAGFSQLDFALDRAGWAIEMSVGLQEFFGVDGNRGLYAWDGPVFKNKYSFPTPSEASQKVKKAAKLLGADLIGIAPYDERWVYGKASKIVMDEQTMQMMHDSEALEKAFKQGLMPNLGVEEADIIFPFQPKSVIVMALEMDYEAINTSQSLIAEATVGNGYSDMVVLSYKVATFLRYLGYNAVPCGNDTALSVPQAIAAGLGELSRIGIVITPEYGPRIRLCKVFTDLELETDKPISFGVTEFCKVCRKCADDCPSGAISQDKEPSFKVCDNTNNPGVKRWTYAGMKCFKYWCESNYSCSICISTCPYNKIDEWHHNLAMTSTRTPARPFLRYFDELFGYGKIQDFKAMEDFWKS